MNLKFEERDETFKIKKLLGIRTWKKDGINVIRFLAQMEPANSLGVNPDLFLSLHLPLTENYEEKALQKNINKYLKAESGYSFSFTKPVIARTNNFSNDESGIEEIYINDLTMTKKGKSKSFLSELLSDKEALAIKQKNPSNTFLYAKSRLKKRQGLNQLNVTDYSSNKTLMGQIFNANKENIEEARKNFKEFKVENFYSKRFPIKASATKQTKLFAKAANRYSDIFNFVTINDGDKKLKLQIPVLHDSDVNLATIQKSEKVMVSIFKSKGPYMALIKFPSESHEFLAFISAGTLYDSSYTKDYNDALVEDIYFLSIRKFDTLSCDDIYCIAGKVLGNIPIIKLKITDKKTGGAKEYTTSLGAYENEGAVITYLTALSIDIGDTIKVSSKIADNYKNYHLGSGLAGKGAVDAAYNQEGHEIMFYIHDGI
ncbi:MAG: hypothetical protein HRT47_07800 [Candidatus Caenarcaniphilales bacterium]|nr:hypothetical protein [Candidatus Caenarcaniphilales bacterium]